jgi:hypothetical protein
MALLVQSAAPDFVGTEVAGSPEGTHAEDPAASTLHMFTFITYRYNLFPSLLVQSAAPDFVGTEVAGSPEGTHAENPAASTNEVNSLILRHSHSFLS